MALSLSLTAAVLLLLAVWLLWGPDNDNGCHAPAPEEPPAERRLDLEPFPSILAAAQLAKFELGSLAKRKVLCPDCKATGVFYIEDPTRPGAQLGVCRRCARVRFGETLVL